MANFRPLDPSRRNTASSNEQQMGIEYYDGDAGDITSREAGNMVKRMIEFAERRFKMAEISNVPNKIAPHETFGIHELMQLKKYLCAQILRLNRQRSRSRLKIYLESDLQTSQRQIKELRALIQQSGYQTQT
jgi:hypothetical protein